jgi:hypothetical protein
MANDTQTPDERIEAGGYLLVWVTSSVTGAPPTWGVAPRDAAESLELWWPRPMDFTEDQLRDWLISKGIPQDVAEDGAARAAAKRPGLSANAPQPPPEA